MSVKNSVSSSCLSEKTSKLLNRFENVSFSRISKEKEDEIKRLLGSVKSKHKRYYTLRQIDDVSILSNQIIKKELLETYALNTDCHVFNPGTNVIFGLNEVDISNRKTSNEKFPFLNGEKGRGLVDLRLTGCNYNVNFPPKLLHKKIEMLEATSSLLQEQISILECLEECKSIADKIRRLKLLKNQTITKAAETNLKELNSLFSEVLLLKYAVLKDYFSEDKRVVDASYKLKDHFNNTLEKLQSKENDLNKKMLAFKQLERTKFDRLLMEYRAICNSITQRKWTLENLMR